MLKKRLNGALLLLVVAFAPAMGLAVASEPGSEVAWGEKPTEAFALSGSSGRPVAVDFWAIWCAPCKLMDETTYRDPAVVEAMEGFVGLKVNADANEIFVDRYSVDAFPTLLFLDENGDEITRLTGMIESPRLLAALPGIRDGYDSYLSNLADKKSARSLQVAAKYLFDVGNDDGAASLLKRALKLAKKGEPESVDAIELDLALALLAGGRAGSAVKMLELLSEGAASDELKAQALFSLARAERERGNEAKADEALGRLRSAYPALADQWIGTE